MLNVASQCNDCRVHRLLAYEEWLLNNETARQIPFTVDLQSKYIRWLPLNLLPVSRQGGRPMTNNTATVLTTAKIWS
jgi:hypothetical protein